MKYETIIFDIDETLFDFGKAEENALRKVFQEFGIPSGAKLYRESYEKCNKPLWRELEQGFITLEELKVERFRRLFFHEGLDIDASEFSRVFLEYLGQGTYLIPGAVELISSLEDYQLAVITNGFGDVQKARIAGSPLAQAFEQIIVSEEAGIQKPEKGIFEYAFSKLGISNKDKVLMVGDSLTSDIQGGVNVGIDTCWFNPHQKENTNGVNPTYEIRDLLELVKIVESSEPVLII
ncbi:YjjG family noncanonical pyrimidine nucleotidase [Neobacillus kokaensis]|uniref:Noncanonical pyrimidine nucleotidase, YjjG family protein n=1 Tax=Neobacillus kokaensis TaxID=2759023 RepID=A0ABQ3NA24_9BACI|nr:YjjG family noncanonical pyrimidine nucleotidase [Neobacillus kokaensis]GHI00813.1 noncanonical pyrimidine nucleotidase, YjjG family protein [Neobacillus kokaensis]